MRIGTMMKTLMFCDLICCSWSLDVWTPTDSSTVVLRGTVIDCQKFVPFKELKPKKRSMINYHHDMVYSFSKTLQSAIEHEEYAQCIINVKFTFLNNLKVCNE